MKEKKLVLNEKDFFTDNRYIKKSDCVCLEKSVDTEDALKYIALYRIDEITFEEKAPRKEALENVIASMSIPGANFVYMIVGDAKGVSFYYGVAKDMSCNDCVMEIKEIGNDILKPSLQGNFRGSGITGLNADATKALMSRIDNFAKVKVVEGVPGINKDDENFQSVDRLIDVMLGTEFAFILIAKPLCANDATAIQSRMYELYDSLSPLAKSSVQENDSNNESTLESTTDSKSSLKGKNSSHTEQKGTGTNNQTTHGESKGTSQSNTITTKPDKSSDNSTANVKSGNEGSSTSKIDSESKSESKSDTTGNSSSETENHSTSITKQKSTNTGRATTQEIVNKNVQEWIKFLDEVIFPRLDYGTGKGLFVSDAVILGNNEADLIRLENTIRSIYGGEAGNKMPLKAFEISAKEKSLIRRFQIPELVFKKALENDEANLRTVCSQMIVDTDHCLLGSWLSSKELSLFAGLPQKEVVGLALREEIRFGLNVNRTEAACVKLGYLVQNGVVLNGENNTPCIPVNLDRKYFDKHIFVTGVTGSGKTTTCQKLLLNSEGGFLVIEPAKTEYRILTDSFKDMLVFTLGKENGAPFRLNPFEFFPGENITSRVDMIKASMEAAFDMEAAIPQILEAAIYSCYEKKGWDISSNQNRLYKDPFAGDVQAFPTLKELEDEIENVVKDQGFDERLKNDYIGSIKARLKGLTVGAKGLMLNTPRSVDFRELLYKKVVLELENIKSASEKSLIMGFILTNLSEAIRAEYAEKGHPIKHITLVEEAHRLLSKYTPGDSLNKKQGVEMFSDMLAEVRKYGEALIVADQIPNKLTPEVLKNTNTKIVHKIFAQDDKEAIGNTMALKDEQKGYLSYLEPGSAVMMSPGLSKAIQIQIERNEQNNTERVPPDDKQLRSRILSYYASEYKKGVIPGLNVLKNKPSPQKVDFFLQYLHKDSAWIRQFIQFGKEPRFEKAQAKIEPAENFITEIKKIKEAGMIDAAVDYIFIFYCSQNAQLNYPSEKNSIKNVISLIADSNIEDAWKKYHAKLDEIL